MKLVVWKNNLVGQILCQSPWVLKKTAYFKIFRYELDICDFYRIRYGISGKFYRRILPGKILQRGIFKIMTRLSSTWVYFSRFFQYFSKMSDDWRHSFIYFGSYYFISVLWVDISPKSSGKEFDAKIFFWPKCFFIYLTPFLGPAGFLYKIRPLNYYFKRRASYRFKA